MNKIEVLELLRELVCAANEDAANGSKFRRALFAGIAATIIDETQGKLCEFTCSRCKKAFVRRPKCLAPGETICCPDCGNPMKKGK